MQNIFELNNVIAVLLAYFIGSIPSAIWVSKWFFGVDVRDYGSNNAGATNTFRVIGRVAGFTVLFFDILKGWVSVKILTSLILYEPQSSEFINMQLVLNVSYWKKIAASSRKDPNITKSDVNGMKIYIPSLIEQERISKIYCFLKEI